MHDEQTSEAAVGREQRAIGDLYAQLREAKIEVAGPDGRPQSLPPDLHAFLSQLLDATKVGRRVTILQTDAVLTTTQAAKQLAVSRQFLVQLLDKGEIPSHLVGTHRRVYARDVFAYRAQRDAARRQILDDLARTEMNEGLYDRVPLNDSASQQ